MGTEKTGTSSIQLFLRKNRKALARHGYHFLQSAGKTNNWRLPAFCSVENRFDDFYRLQAIATDQQLDEFKEQFLNDFEKELRTVAKNVHTIVISSEHFHSRLRSDAEMSNLQQFLSTYFEEIQIVCYLREQAETCASWYSTSMKSGSTYSFYEFVRRCKPESYYFNYFDILANWERYFGFESLEVALFSSKHFLNGDLLDDFTARIDPALVGHLDKAVRTVNESIQPMGQALNRALNIAYPLSNEDPDISEIRDKCKDIIAKRLTGKGQQTDFPRRKKIYQSFIDSNEKLRQRHFPALKTVFPPPVEEELKDNEIDGRFLAVLTEIFGVLGEQGKKPIAQEAYLQFWSAIVTSLKDILSVQEGVKEGGKEVVLSEDDAWTFWRAAVHLEWADPANAELLIKLANDINPEIPGIKRKLATYEQRRNEKPRPEFMITFHGDISRNRQPEEAEKMVVRLVAWAATLDTPAGSRVKRVGATSTTIYKDNIKDVDNPLLKGYAIFKAESLEEAIAIAKRCPHIEEGGYLDVFQLQQL
jgi:hypothetical protein